MTIAEAPTTLEAVDQLAAALRVAAWHPHTNLMPERYAARRDAYDDFRAAHARFERTLLPRVLGDERHLVGALDQLDFGRCHANVMGEPYAQRKAAVARARGAVSGYDGVLA